ncbi:chorismate synthase [Bacillus velezensis]
MDSKLAAAVLSINAFKGVEFGIGFEAAKQKRQ